VAGVSGKGVGFLLGWWVGRAFFAGGWLGRVFFEGGDKTERRFFYLGPPPPPPFIVKVSYCRLLSICFVSIGKQTTVTTHTHTKRQHQEGPATNPAPPGYLRLQRPTCTFRMGKFGFREHFMFGGTHAQNFLG
jgi:hypothetical protein